MTTYTAQVVVQGEGDYMVKTNLPPELLSELSMLVFQAWLAFAIGIETLGGKRLMHPTGKYASSIRHQASGDSKVAIFADDSIADYASILETGHGLFDLKTKFQKGRAYPMHRGDSNFVSSKPSSWAQQRSAGFTGFAAVGDTGWILPAMPAYEPAKILADLAAEAARSAPT